MKKFTYNQYIKSIHTLRLNAVLRLAEESTEYYFSTEKIENKHDKLIKRILSEKSEMAKFINDFLESRNKIKEENLERYTNSFITKKCKTKECDLVYKVKNKELFFLIEHQSSVDSNMPYRLLNYCIDIIQERTRNNRENKEYRYPIIVPIVIYTGKNKWKVSNNFADKQISDYIFENYKINFEYNLVDINKLNNYILFSKNSLFGYGMLLEKTNTKEEIKEMFDKIINVASNKKYFEELSRIVIYFFDETLSYNEQLEILNKIDRKVGEEKMGRYKESMLEKNYRIKTEKMIKAKKELEEAKKVAKIEGRAEGEKKKTKDIVKNMINKKCTDDFIIEVTRNQ